MHIKELNPIIAVDPVASAKFGSKVYSLLFTCPLCGPPHRMALFMHEGEPQPGLWRVTDLASGDINLTPSIVNDFHGFKPCGLHVVVSKGIV
jgi:hypothetical protein